MGGHDSPSMPSLRNGTTVGDGGSLLSQDLFLVVCSEEMHLQPLALWIESRRAKYCSLYGL